MSDPTRDYRVCEQLVAGLLRGGTWLASASIAAGLLVEMWHRAAKPAPHSLNGFEAVKVGVALIIFLPIARVALMFAFFLRERDYVFTAISALVLAIIGIGFFVRL